MRVNANAGGFELVSYTDGYPYWATLLYKEKEIARFSHSELADLEYVVGQLRARLRAAVPESGKGEI